MSSRLHLRILAENPFQLGGVSCRDLGQIRLLHIKIFSQIFYENLAKLQLDSKLTNDLYQQVTSYILRIWRAFFSMDFTRMDSFDRQKKYFGSLNLIKFPKELQESLLPILCESVDEVYQSARLSSWAWLLSKDFSVELSLSPGWANILNANDHLYFSEQPVEAIFVPNPVWMTAPLHPLFLKAGHYKVPIFTTYRVETLREYPQLESFLVKNYEELKTKLNALR